MILLRFYQRFISPLLGSRCRFYPSCSAYASLAIENYSYVKAFRLILKRILKCHPYHPGGIDYP